MFARMSFNKCFYIVGTQEDLLAFCELVNLNPNWIREKDGVFYLRLWNSYKAKIKKVWEQLQEYKGC